MSVIKSIDLGDLTRMIHSIEWMNEVPPTPTTFPTELQYNGVVYKVITQAVAMNVGEYVTLEAQAKETHEDIVANLHNILAAFIKPKDPTVPTDFKTRADTFKSQMSIGVAYPLGVFFCLIYEQCLGSIKHYSVNHAIRETKKLKRLLNKKNRKTSLDDFSG